MSTATETLSSSNPKTFLNISLGVFIMGAGAYFLWSIYKEKHEIMLMEQRREEELRRQNIQNDFGNNWVSLSRENILNMLDEIKHLSSEDIPRIKTRFRADRRKNLNNERKYVEINKRMHIALENIVSNTLESVLRSHDLNQESFEKSLEIHRDDEEIRELLNSLCTEVINMEDPVNSNLNEDIIREILQFHQQIYADILKDSDSNTIDYELLNSKIQDKVYLKYGVEFEEIAAFYKNKGIENLSGDEMNNLKQSTSLLLKMNKSLSLLDSI